VREGFAATEPSAGATLPLANMWDAVNAVRAVGAAPIIDAIRTARGIVEDLDFATAPAAPEHQQAYLDAFSLYLLPMLDGISRQEAAGIASAVADALALPAAERAELERRLFAVAT